MFSASHFSIHATCLAHLILLDLIILIISGEDYKVSHYAALSTHQRLLGPNILLSTLFSNILKNSNYFLPVGRETNFHTHTKQQVNILTKQSRIADRGWS
jgi:hypothetical protein